MRRVIVGIAIALAILLTAPRALAYTTAFRSHYLNSGVFNCSQYLARYPDLVAASLTCTLDSVDNYETSSASRHWLTFGIPEGRIGVDTFWTRGYLAANPDVQGFFDLYGFVDGRLYWAIFHIVDTGEWGRHHGILSLTSHYVGGAIRVLGGHSSVFSYDFSATKVGDYGSWTYPYLAVFDAEAWNCPTGKVGDSTAVRKGVAFDFGTRDATTSGSNVVSTDILISRSTDGTWAGEASGGVCVDSSGVAPTKNNMLYGTSNPQMIKINGSWYIYWINVLNRGKLFDLSSSHTDYDKSSHFMSVARIDPQFFDSPSEDIRNANMWYFMGSHQEHPEPPYYWGSWNHYYGSAAMIDKDLRYSYPVLENATGDPPSGSPVGADARYASGDTDGLLGAITTNSGGSVYFFYTDKDAYGNWKIFRRSVNTNDPYNFGSAVETDATISGTSPLVKIHWHATLQKYVVLYSCHWVPSPGADHHDVCVQIADDETLDDIDIAQGTDGADYGLHLFDDMSMPSSYRDSNNNFSVGQFGIRKNAEGQHFTDAEGQIIIYIPLGPITATAPYYKDVFAKPVFIR